MRIRRRRAGSWSAHGARRTFRAVRGRRRGLRHAGASRELSRRVSRRGAAARVVERLMPAIRNTRATPRPRRRRRARARLLDRRAARRRRRDCRALAGALPRRRTAAPVRSTSGHAPRMKSRSVASAEIQSPTTARAGNRARCHEKSTEPPARGGIALDGHALRHSAERLQDPPTRGSRRPTPARRRTNGPTSRGPSPMLPPAKASVIATRKPATTGNAAVVAALDQVIARAQPEPRQARASASRTQARPSIR